MGTITFEVEMVDIDVTDATTKMEAIKTKVALIDGATLMGLRFQEEKE